jgi:DNA-binding response OmpR family regulator
MARARIGCRHRHRRLAVAGKTSSDNHLRILDIKIDIASWTVWRSGEIIDLLELSFRLLRTPATHAPAMVSKDQLIAKV